MNTSVLDALIDRWRAEAWLLERRGAPEQARALAVCGDELEATITAWLDESLTLTEAAAESGYTAGHLGRLIRAGALPNSGRAGAPRIQRRHLPVRGPGARLATVSVDTHNIREQIVRDAIGTGE